MYISIKIHKNILVPVDVVLKKYPKLRKKHVIGKLAVKLVKQYFFGEDILRQCTVMGCRTCIFPALPINELNDLKQTIFSFFPNYWNSPA